MIVSGIRQPSILGALRAVAVDDDMLYYGIRTPGHLLDAVSTLGGAKMNALPDGRSVMIKEYIDVKKAIDRLFLLRRSFGSLPAFMRDL